MSEKTRNTLNRLCEAFKKNEYAAIMKLEGEDGYDTDTLSALIPDYGIDNDEVMAEYVFEDAGKDEVAFVCLISLSEELSEDHAMELHSAIARLNYYLPLGNFGMDMLNTNLVYKATFLMDRSLSEEDMFNKANSYAGRALKTCEEFVSPILRLSEGNRTLAEFLEYIIE